MVMSTVRRPWGYRGAPNSLFHDRPRSAVHSRGDDGLRLGYQRDGAGETVDFHRLIHSKSASPPTRRVGTTKSAHGIQSGNDESGLEKFGLRSLCDASEGYTVTIG